MIVEDEVEILFLVKMLLEKAGYEAIEALDGVEALEKLRKEKVDLVLLDITLPEKDGWSVLEEIKREEEFKDLPVIVFTGKPEDNRDRKYILSYHLPVIRKPFDCDTLIETIALGMEAARA